MTDENLPTREKVGKNKPYKKVTIDGVRKRRSHYIWFLNTGYWPDWKNKREVIHHIDGDSLNDDFSNLQLMTDAKHISHHNPIPIYQPVGGCIVDKMVGKWGPYRYHVTKHKGKQEWKYLGKTSKFED